ncbi:MAG: sugar phosphate nucleotidyltransferase [Candidatus Zixiibacteriota bacterium]
MVNVIIPAAGVGTRLRPHTHTAPKPLLPVAGQPILGHILDRIVGIPDLGRICLVVGFLGEQIEAFVHEHYKLDVDFIQQSELRGLGYAVHLALASLPGDDALVVILGDTILDVDFPAIASGDEDYLGVKEVDDPRRFGVAEVADGFVQRLVEKPAVPPSHWAVVGLYGIRSTRLFRDCLAQVVRLGEGATGEIQMTDALQMMIDHGARLRAVPVEGWYDCGKPETLLATNRHLLAKYPARYAIEGSVVVSPVSIAPSATIERSIIGPYVSIGERTRITEAVIKNSIIAEDARVSGCVLEDSIIGAHALVEGFGRRLSVGESSEVVLP